MVTDTEVKVVVRAPHEHQVRFITSKAKRKVIRAGRRSGKTVGIAIMAVRRFLSGHRVLYAAPTSEQLSRFWFECCRALGEGIAAGVWRKDETEHVIEVVGTENRIRAKTAWNANTLRGDYADLLILDEWQLMAEDAWEDVGAPMLIDNNGDAVFIYTPPSMKSSGVSKARDPRHAAKMYVAAKIDKTGRWETFHFTSHDNPHLSKEALAEVSQDMSRESYNKEIMAQDDELSPSKLVYGMFNEAVCKIHRFEIPVTWPRYSGHDFGPANPAGLFIAQDTATGLFFAYHEYCPGAGRSTAEHVEEFKEITKGQTVIKRVGGNKTSEDEIRQGYTAHGWPITAPTITGVKAQIDRVQGIMGQNKLYIFRDLSNYLEEIFNCLWKLDQEGHVTNDIDNEAKYHLCACARYILSDFRPDTVIREKPKQRIY